MERDNENDQPCEQPDEVQNIDTVADIKTAQDMFKIMLETMEKKFSETNQKLSETNQKMSESYGNLEKKLDETNQKLSEMQESNHNFYINLETKLDKFNLNIEKKLSENYVSEFGVRIKGKNENEFGSVVESKLEQNVEDITAVM
jgi:hypothetical protein